MAVTRRILRGVSAAVEWENVDQEGAVANASGAVTVAVARADGTEVLPAGSATTTPGAGRYQRALTAAQNAELDVLTFTWTDGGDGSTHTTDVDVVGRYYFGVAEVRAAYSEITESRHPDARVLHYRQVVEEEAEAICGVAFVPRFATVRMDGDGTGTLLLPHPMTRRIRAVRVYSTPTEFTAFTQEQLDAIDIDDAGVLDLVAGSFPCGRRNVEVHYEHGYDEPPRELVEKAMMRLADVIAAPKSSVGTRATTFTAEAGGGTFRLDTAKRRKTGMPEVDATYERHSFWVPGIGA